MLYLLVALLHALLVQPEWRWVWRDGTVGEAHGKPTLSAERAANLDHAWAWSLLAPPRRLQGNLPSALEPAAPRRLLTVRVARPPGVSARRKLRLIAAPVAMWNDLPEAALPSWPVPDDGRLALPIDATQRWRLRLAGSGMGTWWTDVSAGHQGPVMLVPTAGTDIDIRVGTSDGSAIGAVTLRLATAFRGRQGDPFLASVRGEQGHLQLAGLPDAFVLTATVTEPLHAPALLTGRPSELPAAVALGPGTLLSGRIADREGRPVGDAVVAVEGFLTDEEPQLFVRAEKSAADGTFRLPGVPPGELALSVRASGFVLLRERLAELPGARSLGTLVLEKGRGLSVRVVDDQSAPVPGARVEAPGSKAVADERGAVTLSGIPAAGSVIQASAPRHLPASVEVAPPFATPLRLTLPRASTWTGRLVDAAHAPVADATWQLRRGSSFQEEPVADDGQFEIDLRPEEEAELTLRSPGTREVRLPLPPGPAGEIHDLGDVVAPAGMSVTGRVVEAADGTPIAGAQVWLPRPGPMGPAVAWAAGDLLQAHSDATGRFRLQGLSPGPAVLRVEAAGRARRQVDLSLDPGAPELDIGDLPLASGATLRVLVTAPAGKPAVARADLRGQWLEADLLTAPVEDGVAGLHHVPAGPAVVSALAGRKLLCEHKVSVPAGEETLEVDCRRPALAVSGIVTVGGKSAGEGLLAFTLPSPSVPGQILTEVSPGGLRQYQVFGAGRPAVEVPVALDGSFATDELAPGAWQVLWSPAGGVRSPAKELLIPATERFETVLDFPGNAVSGWVVDDGDRPVAEARVRELTRGAFALSGPDGSFVLSGLPAGALKLQAQHEERTSDIVEVPMGSERRPAPIVLRLEKRSPTQVIVRVVDPAGAPAAGAFVFLEEEGTGARILTTDVAGGAAASFSDHFPTRLRAAAWGTSGWAFGEWMAGEQAVEAGLALALPGGGTLVVSCRETCGPTSLVTSSGWDLSRLLLRLGTLPTPASDAPLRLTGLPAGLYSVTAGTRSQTVAVRQGESVEARLDP